MKSKIRMDITRWLKDVKFQAKEFIFKEMKIHHVVVVLAIALIIGVWTTLLTSFDIMPRDNNPEPRQMCWKWENKTGGYVILDVSEDKEAIKIKRLITITLKEPSVIGC